MKKQPTWRKTRHTKKCFVSKMLTIYKQHKKELETKRYRDMLNFLFMKYVEIVPEKLRWKFNLLKLTQAEQAIWQGILALDLLEQSKTKPNENNT